MKKYIIGLIIVILSIFLIIYTVKSDNTPKYDAEMFSNCTLLEENEFHALYQCPSDTEWIVNVKQNEPTGMFKYNFDNDENVFNLVMNDTEHEYIEVAFNEVDICAENYTIRTRIKQPSDENWAFVGCR